MIDTQRLQLIPYAAEDLLALAGGYEDFERSFGLPAASGLRDFIVSGEVPPDWLAQLRSSSGTDPWIYGFAVIHRRSRSVIGSVGFKGPPDEAGMSEIAYAIVPPLQGQGFATEAAAAGVRFALASGVQCVRAHTLPTGNASTRVLEKCGFQWLGEVDDPEDGLVWRWECYASDQGRDLS